MQQVMRQTMDYRSALPKFFFLPPSNSFRPNVLHLDQRPASLRTVSLVHDGTPDSGPPVSELFACLLAVKLFGIDNRHSARPHVEFSELALAPRLRVTMANFLKTRVHFSPYFRKLSAHLSPEGLSSFDVHRETRCLSVTRRRRTKKSPSPPSSPSWNRLRVFRRFLR